jgi:2-polyprenyl-6-methoxyphenol hydroxylase-like FAD-dependent oxidoreductase
MVRSTIAPRAAVLGSGVAGLFATRVLSDHFDEVILIERDEVADSPATRGGVPQGKHVHALLPGGLNVAKEMFPGFTTDLEAAGAVPCVAGQDIFAFRPEGKSYALGTYQPTPRPSGTVYFMTRGLLEQALRRRVEAHPRVLTRYQALVREPIVEHERVVGVILDDGERIEADLVVDATGRNASSVRWLSILGFEEPARSVVNCDFAYASAVLRPEDPKAIDGVCLFVIPGPDSEHNTRFAYLARVEEDLWLAGLGGRFGDYPPADPKGWRDFGRTLAWPIWDELVSTAEPITHPAPFKFPRSVRRHFERLDRFPEGLLPLGDAVCHFNPVYGQGMSAAACQAMALGELLEQRSADPRALAGVATEFFPRAFEVTRTPWALAAAADFQDSRTTGDFPVEEIESLALFLSLTTLIDTDPEAAQLANDLVTLVRPLSALHEPPWPERLSQIAARDAPAEPRYA